MEAPVVIPRGLQARLSRALDSCQVVFVSAGAGWGKTTAARRLLEKRSGEYIPLRRRPLPRSFPLRRLVVLDDFQTLFSTPGARRFQELLGRAPPSQRFLLLSRGPLPEYLAPYEAAGDLLRLGTEDLALDMDALARLARSCRAPLTVRDLGRLRQVTGGNPVAARALLSQLARGRPFCRETEEDAAAQVGEYLDGAVFRRLEPDAWRVLLDSALFPFVTPGLIETLTGGRAGEPALEGLRQTTGLLERDGERWFLSGGQGLRSLLKRRAAETCAPETLWGLRRAAGEWYEERGDWKSALAQYRQADSRGDMIRVLADAARRRPDTREEAREYYALLSPAEVESSPDLMAAMSMLCSASFQVAEAERWYRALKARVSSMAEEDGDRPRARGLLAYLDIALPHRGSGALGQTLAAVGPTLAAGELVLPPMSVTAGLPSILRGGKDISRWAAQDANWYDTLRSWAEAAPGRRGAGLGELALTERRLERGEDVSGRLPALASLQQRLRAAGAPELEFVAVALQARILYAAGALDRAAARLEAFRAGMAEAGSVRLLPNIDAMLCRLRLMGDDGAADIRLEEPAPEEGRFPAGARYRDLTRARCDIRRGEVCSALALLGRALEDGARFDRSLDRLETLLLTAICRFRVGGEDWRAYLTQAVELGERFGYVAVFAREGAALLPLLERYDARRVEPEYWRRARTGVIVQAGYYSGYLRPSPLSAGPLTDREGLVLRLVGQDKTNREIAAVLGVKVSTVKTHLRGVFQKLGVSSRAEAKEAARLWTGR